MLQPIVDVGMMPAGVVSRRGFLKSFGAAAGAAGALRIGWRDLLMAQAAELRSAGKSMILLWMDGGPSQYDTFNPKIGSEYQGPAGAINTCLSGVQVAEYWPRTAAVMDKIALIRSMHSKEKEHDRAIALVRTGYPPSEAIRYPAFGSLVARERTEVSFDLPAFVRIGKPRITTRDVDAGVLGVQYNPFKIDLPGKLPPDLVPTVAPNVLRRRLELSQRLDAEFAQAGAGDAVEQKRRIYDRTARFVLSPRVGAFDLSSEPAKLREAYGPSTFGQGCLLARRLVEQGVSFVEVISTGSKSDQGWDTHKLGHEQNPLLCQETDPAYATLLTDLSDRGLLDNTLVVWMGEFCRTPKFKSDGGRDHYSEGWLVGLSGGGVKMGRVIGATDKDGVKVTDRPIGVPDLFFTFCQILGLDPHQEYTTTDQRPVKLVDGGELIKELL
jgi:hypothetical protein